MKTSTNFAVFAKFNYNKTFGNNLTDSRSRISLHVSHLKRGQRLCTAAEQQPCSCLGQGCSRKDEVVLEVTVEAVETQCLFASRQLTIWGFAELSHSEQSLSLIRQPPVLHWSKNLCLRITPFTHFLPKCSFKLPVSDSPRPFFWSREGHSREKTRVDWILAGLHV